MLITAVCLIMQASRFYTSDQFAAEHVKPASAKTKTNYITFLAAWKRDCASVLMDLRNAPAARLVNSAPCTFCGQIHGSLPGHQLLREQPNARAAAAPVPPAHSHFRAASRGAPSSAAAARGCPGGARPQRLCRASPARQGALPAWSPPSGPFYSPRCRGGGRSRRPPACAGNHEGGGSGRAHCRPGEGGAGSPAPRARAAAGRTALGGGGSAARGRPLGACGHGPRSCRPPVLPPSAALRHGPAWAGRVPLPPLASVPLSGFQPSPPLLAAAPLRAPRAFSLCLKVGEESAAGGRAALPHRARPGEAASGAPVAGGRRADAARAAPPARR